MYFGARNINRKGSLNIDDLKIYIVWVTKYRSPVLKGGIQRCCRDILRQVCDANDIRILKGVVSKDHIHLHYPAKLSISELLKRLKGAIERVS